MQCAVGGRQMQRTMRPERRSVMSATEWRLYEINQLLLDAIHAANEKADPETGEIPADWCTFLDGVEIERNTKCLHVARYIKSLRAEAGAVTAERDALAHRAKMLTNKADSLKQYLAGAVQPGEELKDGTTRISWRKSTSVSVLNETAIPEAYWKIEKRPMLREIGDALKSGDQVPGCVLSENKNIQIR